MVILAVQWLMLLVPGIVMPLSMIHIFGLFLAPLLGMLALSVWWLFASGLRWRDRWHALVVCAALGTLSIFLAHPTLGVFGAMGTRSGGETVTDQ